MIDNHGLGAAFCLRAFTRIVHNKRINMRCWPENGIRPAACRQRNAFTRQPLKVAMFADVHDGIHGKLIAQPEIKREIRMWWHEVGVVIRRV